MPFSDADALRARLRRLAHKERHKLDADALEIICRAFFADRGWYRKEHDRILLACRDGLPLGQLGTPAAAYLTAYRTDGRIDEGALVIEHADLTKVIYPYETTEDVVILFYRLYRGLLGLYKPAGGDRQTEP